MAPPEIESQVPLDAEVWSVSELNAEARAVLEDQFHSLWITGEISNLARPGSGHLYFSLKDDAAEVRCAMFRGQNRQLRFRPDNGDQVIVRGRATIYAARGSYQLVVEHMEPAGEGLLRRRLEELKAKLQAEGLFDESHKQALPSLPRRIGIVTSPTGAAVHDILQILARRFPAVPVIIYPTQVQGDRAQHEIAAAVEAAVRRNECDVLIVGRGGGSLEDLWAFNEERVIRAIFACPIPVVSAVGHEVDFTITDLVADVRAPTPSAAAELVVPDASGITRGLQAADQRLANALRRRIIERRRMLEQLRGRVGRRHPGLILQRHAQRIDELTQRFTAALTRRVDFDRMQLANSQGRLRNAAPLALIERQRQAVGQARLQMAASMQKLLATTRGELSALAAGLDGVSPLQTLQRGYAIVADANTGVVLRDAAALQAGQRITGKLADGGFEATIDKTTTDNEKSARDRD
jgi:exodeoxyribonuclease VII large subunit